MANSVNLDSMLGQEILVFLKTLNKILFLEAFFPATRRLGRYDPAFNFGLDTVGARFILVATNLALLAEDTAGTSSQLDIRRVLKLLLLLWGRAGDTGYAIRVGHDKPQRGPSQRVRRVGRFGPGRVDTVIRSRTARCKADVGSGVSEYNGYGTPVVGAETRCQQQSCALSTRWR